MTQKPTITDFLSVLFRAGEFAAYTKNPEGTRVFPVEQPPSWVQFFALNPLDGHQDREPSDPEKHSADRPRRADANVTAYRNILMELDEMPLQHQRPYVDASGVPWSTCVFSGSKSYHFIISLTESLPDRESYAQVVSWLHNILGEIDHSTKNPSRLTRFPGVVRDGKGVVQELIEVRGRVSTEDLMAFLNRYPEAKPAPLPQLTDVVLPEGEKGFLSKRTKRFLMFGADVGQRNTELHQAARDMLQNGWILEEAAPMLYDAMKDHPDFKEKEFWATVRSAFGKPAKFPPRI